MWNRFVLLLLLLSYFFSFSQSLQCNFSFSKKKVCVGDTVWIYNNSIGGQRFYIDFDEELLEDLNYAEIYTFNLGDSIGANCYSHRIFKDRNGDYYLVTGCGTQLTIMAMGRNPENPQWRRLYSISSGISIRDIRILSFEDSLAIFLHASNCQIKGYLFPDPFQPTPRVINFGNFGGQVSCSNGQDLCVVRFDTTKIAFYSVGYGNPSIIHSIELDSLNAFPGSASVTTTQQTGLLSLAYINQSQELELWGGYLSTSSLYHYHFSKPNMGFPATFSFPINISGSNFPINLYKGAFIYNRSPLVLRGKTPGNIFPLIRLLQEESNNASWTGLNLTSISGSVGADFLRYNGNIYACFISYNSNSTYVLVKFYEEHNEGDTLFSHYNPIYHVYSQPDTYVVQCIAYNDTFGMDIQLDTIIVLPKSYGNIFVQNVCAAQPATFEFIPVDTFAILSYLWLFGDGDSANISNPSHVYLSGGDYQYSLIIQNQFGCYSEFFDSIKVHSPPVANFSYTISDCADVPVQFQNQSWLDPNDSLIFIRWDFGDGIFSVEENPVHLYSGGGAFSVKLLVTSDKGCSDSITQTINIPGLSYTNTPLCKDEIVTFNGTAFYPSSTVTNMYWNLYDKGGQLLDTDLNTSIYHYVFSDTGTYTLEFIVTTQNGCVDTFRKSLKVYLKPYGDFKFDSIRCINNPIHLVAESYTLDVPITQYLWEFHDVSPPVQKVGKEVTYIFANSGDHLVKLYLINEKGCDTVIEKSISVGTSPSANFSLPDSLCIRDSIIPINTTWSNDSIQQWLWILSENTFSLLKNPAFQVDTPGNYSLTLIAYAKGYCSDTMTKIFTVVPSPTFAPPILPDTINAPAQLWLTASTSSGNSYYWYLNDSLLSFNEPYLLTFNENANNLFTILLKVVNEFGCIEQWEKDLFVLSAPPPYYDVAILDMEIELDTLGFWVVLPIVQNLSNRDIFYLDWTISLADQNKIQFATSDTLLEGKVKQFYIPIRIQMNPYLETSYVCLTVKNPNHFIDIDQENNQYCKELKGSNVLLNSFPNPVKRELTLVYSLAEPQIIRIELYQSDGKLVFHQIVEGKQGVNRLTFPMTRYASGMYYLILKTKSKHIVTPIIKN